MSRAPDTGKPGPEGPGLRAAFLAAFLAAAGAAAASEHGLLWMRTYDGPGHLDDRAEGVAVDAAGNIYVAGYSDRGDASQGDAAVLVKYLPDGTVDASFGSSGVVTCNSFPFGDDRAYGVAVAPDGSIYLAGVTDTLAGPFDAWLRKLGPSGAEIWTRTYDSVAKSHEFFYDVAVDATGGAVAVVGRERRNDIGQAYNWLVQKYDSAGTLLWTRSYSGPGYFYDDEASRVAFAPNGDVVAAGFETNVLGDNADVVVRRYSAGGDLLWHRTYGSEAPGYTGDDYAQGVAVDAAGDVYVAGGIKAKDPPSSKTDRWIRKYSADGNTVHWTGRIGSGNAENDHAWDCALAPAGAPHPSSGMLYVTGASGCNANNCQQGDNLVAEVFDRGTGGRIMSSGYDSGNYPNELDDHGRSIAVDSSGNYIVAGYHETQEDTRGTLGAGVVGGKVCVIRGNAAGGGATTLEEYDPLSDKWRPRAGMTVARVSLAVGVFNNKLYCVGGYEAGGLPATVQVYDPATDQWATKAPMSSARGGLAVGVVNGKVFAIGGSSGGGAVATVEMYDPIADAWSPRASMAVPRYAPAAAVHAGKIFVMGGGDGTSTVYSSVEVYDPVADSWMARAAMPTARSELVAEVVSGRIFALGGRSVGGYVKAAEIYDPVADTWEKWIPMPTARAGAVSGAVGGKIYVIGGENASGPVPVVQEYDPAVVLEMKTWAERAEVPAGRFYSGGAAAGDRMYLAGGLDGASAISASLWEFDPAADDWQAKAPMPTARYGLAAAESGGRIYAAGGRQLVPLLAEQAAMEEYDPATDAWTAKAAMPTARFAPGAAGLGGYVYVIGGYNLGVLATVERYDPAGDSWLPMTDMPAARAELAVAAVGGRIYAIGGYDGTGWETDVVEEYNPTGNTWTAKASMPTARYAPAVAVRDGRIYVAGGTTAGAGGPYGDLEIYDPAADTWTAGTGMPTARTALSGAVLGGTLYTVAGVSSGGIASVVEAFYEWTVTGQWSYKEDMLLDSGLDWIVRKYSGPVKPPRGLEFLRVYPNPYRPAEAVGGALKFANLPDGATVHIYTVRGLLVKKIHAQGKTAAWHGRNEDGEPVATGVYMYKASVPGKDPATGKFALIR